MRVTVATIINVNLEYVVTKAPVIKRFAMKWMAVFLPLVAAVFKAVGVTIDM